MSMLRICLFLSLIIAYPGEAQHRVVVKDMSHQFQVFSGGQYISADSAVGKKKTVYVSVNADDYKGTFVEVESQKPSLLFINGELVQDLRVGKTTLSLDSLSAIYASMLTFALHNTSESRPDDYIVSIIAFSPTATVDYDPLKRNLTHFHNFSILASGILLLCFVLLYRSNPQLLFDYFNFIKLFSVQEREESILITKIVGSGNLLFYGMASMCLSFLLLVINFYFRAQWGWVQLYEYQSLARLLFSWLSLSMLVFSLLILKSILVFSISRLFDFSEATTVQFFNFIRLLFLINLLIGLLLVIYFVFGVTLKLAYVRLFYIISTLLAFWIPIVFLKLLKRSPYSTFHLFSYLCATEIFPVVIVIKLLFL